jgi:hypothetical protein
MVTRPSGTSSPSATAASRFARSARAARIDVVRALSCRTRPRAE